jgi:hypothetical protein
MELEGIIGSIVNTTFEKIKINENLVEQELETIK